MKVKKKQLSGKIANFPLHVVQKMVDEQVKQGNPANPSVFAADAEAGKNEGGFTWRESDLSNNTWAAIIIDGAFHLIPKPEKPQGHVHAKVMRQYAKDAKVSPTPWENWEFRIEGEKKWRTLDAHPLWVEATQYRRKSDDRAEPEPEPEPEPASKVQPTPNEIVRAMLAKGMVVWAGVSDYAYDEARERLSKNVYRVTEYVKGSNFPVRTGVNSWVYAVPINTETMTEITEMP